MRKGKRDYYETIKSECQTLQDMVFEGDPFYIEKHEAEKQILESTIKIWRAVKGIEGKKVKYNGVPD